MNYKEYRHMVIETEKGSLTDYPKVLHAIMGMNGEAGECIDILKKHMFQGHKLDVEHLLEELGDVCWYAMLFTTEIPIDVEQIFAYSYNENDYYDGKEKALYMGSNYFLNINYICGSFAGNYGDKFMLIGPDIYYTLRHLFYNIKMAAKMFDKTLEDIFDINCKKIKERYPNGFSTDKSINRTPELFPILGTPYSIPYDMIKLHERQAIKNHDQDLKRLAERGGLSWAELMCVLLDKGYEKIDESKAKDWVLNEMKNKELVYDSNGKVIGYMYTIKERGEKTNGTI